MQMNDFMHYFVLLIDWKKAIKFLNKWGGKVHEIPYNKENNLSKINKMSSSNLFKNSNCKIVLLSRHCVLKMFLIKLVIHKGWFDEFETGLNIIIAIVQKV